MKTILYSDDVNLLAHWEKSCQDTYVVVDDLDELKDLRDSVIIVNYTALNSTHRELIPELDKSNNLVLVLHRTPDIKTAREILALGAKGYGNALMKDYFIMAAIETIKDGMIWLHPEFTSQLIAQIPSNSQNDITPFLEKLSEREKEVALLLKDGDAYKIIAQKLAITARTVKAHAHNIYAKLNVKDRLALALLLK